jgi:hypothetical protein
MKKISIILIVFLFSKEIYSQVTDLAPDNYKVINIGTNGNRNYTKSVILLHEIYNADSEIKISKNYAIGEIIGMRGRTTSNNRNNAVSINTSSAYNKNSGTIVSTNGDGT